MRYNLACKIKQCFNCYEYSHVLVSCQKKTKYEACSNQDKTSECPQDRAQKCPLCNNTHTSLDKQCEYRKKKYLRIEAAKKCMPRLNEVRSKTNSLRRESSKNMRPPPKSQQRSQSINASPQSQTSQLSASVIGKNRRSSYNGRPLPQIFAGNASRFTTQGKV